MEVVADEIAENKKQYSKPELARLYDTRRDSCRWIAEIWNATEKQWEVRRDDGTPLSFDEATVLPQDTIVKVYAHQSVEQGIRPMNKWKGYKYWNPGTIRGWNHTKVVLK